MEYASFLESKRIRNVDSGFQVNTRALNPVLFDWQKEIVKWALMKGKAAIFADCGLGKTFMQLEWAHNVSSRTGKPVLILAPLAVSAQTKREGEKLGTSVNVCRSVSDMTNGVNITNYEMLNHFNGRDVSGVVLDESSILKSFAGKIKQRIIDKFKDTPYKLACTATPAPNDHMELGNHAEFLNTMSRSEMLATYFVHDGGDTAKWRLKGHARGKFWEWVASWATMFKTPSDLGYSSDGYILPALAIHEKILRSLPDEGALFVNRAQTLNERRKARVDSIAERIEVTAAIVNNSREPFIVWCDYNEESRRLAKAIDGAVEITGSDSCAHKESSMIAFANNEIKCLVTKPKIAGFGMNWQNCSNIIFCGLSDSYEQFYQAVRRCYRFGQTQMVNVYVVLTEKETTVLQNIKRKEAEAAEMAAEMAGLFTNKIAAASRIEDEYLPTVPMTLPRWIEVA